MRMRGILMVAVTSMLMAGTAMGQDIRSRVSVVLSLTPQPHATVTNNYVSPLTGMGVTMSTTTAHGKVTAIIWYDSGVYYFHNPPLMPGQSYSWAVGPIDAASGYHPQVMVVAFQDGESAGDPQWLSELHARRQAAYKEIGVVTGLLNQALAQDQPSSEISSTLEGMRAALRTSMSDPEARIAAMFVIDKVTVNIEKDSVGGVTGDPQKIVPTIIRPMFSDWRAALQTYDRTMR